MPPPEAISADKKSSIYRMTFEKIKQNCRRLRDRAIRPFHRTKAIGKKEPKVAAESACTMCVITTLSYTCGHPSTRANDFLCPDWADPRHPEPIFKVAVLPVACYSCVHARKCALEGIMGGARDGGQIHGWNGNKWSEIYDNEAVAICGNLQPYGGGLDASSTSVGNSSHETVERDFGAEDAIYWIVRGNSNIAPSGDEIGNQVHGLDRALNSEATMPGNQEDDRQKGEGRDEQRREVYLDYALGGLFSDN